jgi:hypothetical protein
MSNNIKKVQCDTDRGTLKGEYMPEVWEFPEELDQDFTKHVSAMTAEHLNRKSHIAIELARRDFRIRKLEAISEEMLAELDQHIEEIGDCDHQANICGCGIKKIRDRASKILKEKINE